MRKNVAFEFIKMDRKGTNHNFCVGTAYGLLYFQRFIVYSLHNRHIFFSYLQLPREKRELRNKEGARVTVSNL